MLRAWLIAGLAMGILLVPVMQNFNNPEDLQRYINRFLYVGIGSFVLMLVLALMINLV